MVLPVINATDENVYKHTYWQKQNGIDSDDAWQHHLLRCLQCPSSSHFK